MIIRNFGTFVRPSFTANPMQKNCADHINQKLLSAKTADIFCHTSSDEDSFNSAKAMYSYLSANGVKPRIIVSNGKECYKYDTQKYNILQKSEVNDNTKKADIGLCVDFSAQSRAVPNVLKYINEYGRNLVGFDHHNNSDKISQNYNQLDESYSSKGSQPQFKPKDFYIDSSAKSNSAIITRFFDEIGHKMTNEEAGSLLAGMMDDNGKDGHIKIKDNQIFISEKLKDNGYTKEIFEKVLSNIDEKELKEVFNHFAKKAELTPEDIAFRDSLPKKTKYSKNGKMVYVEIKTDDEEWIKLGKDTVRTTAVLGEFRKKMLAANDGVEAVAVFFPTNNKDTYKMSILTRKDYAKQIIENIKNTTYPELTAGGHDDRSGGTIISNDKDTCHKWVKLFVRSADEVLGK